MLRVSRAKSHTKNGKTLAPAAAQGLRPGSRPWGPTVGAPSRRLRNPRTAPLACRGGPNRRRAAREVKGLRHILARPGPAATPNKQAAGAARLAARFRAGRGPWPTGGWAGECAARKRPLNWWLEKIKEIHWGRRSRNSFLQLHTGSYRFPGEFL